jgi:hypothetical protein
MQGRLAELRARPHTCVMIAPASCPSRALSTPLTSARASRSSSTSAQSPLAAAECRAGTALCGDRAAPTSFLRGAQQRQPAACRTLLSGMARFCSSSTAMPVWPCRAAWSSAVSESCARATMRMDSAHIVLPRASYPVVRVHVDADRDALLHGLHVALHRCLVQLRAGRRTGRAPSRRPGQRTAAAPHPAIGAFSRHPALLFGTVLGVDELFVVGAGRQQVGDRKRGAFRRRHVMGVPLG